MNKKTIKILLSSVLMLIVIITCLSGCSFNGGLSVSNYVDTLNNDVHRTVNLTRRYKKIHESLDPRSPEDAKQAIEILNELSDICSEIVKLDAPDRYNDIDDDLKINSSEALASLSELKDLINVSLETGNDKMYKTDSKKLFDKYEKAYLEIVDLNSVAQTRYRND